MKRALLIAVVVVAGCVRQVIPPPKRGPIKAVVARGVERVAVRVSPWGYAGWVVTVKNNRDDQVRIVWDECSFIDTRGLSYGRLIRGRTRILDLARAQPTSPVAPGATVVEYAVSEELAEWKPGVILVDDTESEPADERDLCAERRKECKADAATCAAEHRQCKAAGSSIVSASIVSASVDDKHGVAAPPVKVGVGRIVLVFDGARGREEWEAAVSMDGSPLPKIEPKPVEPKPTSNAESGSPQ